MSEKELEDHLGYTKGLYESFKLEGNHESKVLYHELKIIRSEYTRRINKKNALLARQYEKLKGSKKIIKCPHCKKQVDIKI